MKHILLGITGGIAAYKSCEIVRLLKKNQYAVTVAMTPKATEFVGVATFQALSGRPVLLDTHEAQNNGMAHINITREVDAFLIAPATANTIAKIANGLADNVVTALAAARACPLIMAPAMNTQMWNNPANLRNIQQLQQDGITILKPASGDLACGETGAGRMQEPADIVDLLADTLSPQILENKRILLTVGATFELIDPVRGITNISTGRMGASLARACRAAGAKVTVIAGLMQVPLPVGLTQVIQASSAQEMYRAVMECIHEQDVFISVAAVADYRVAQPSEQKIKKKSDHSSTTLILTENPDILASVAQLPKAPFCVGFAAESENVLEYAKAKKQRKSIPMIIANQVSDAMGKEHNRITILGPQDDEIRLPEMPKDEVANAIVEYLSQCL